MFFIDRSGALVHAWNGRPVNIVGKYLYSKLFRILKADGDRFLDDVPVLGHSRPVASRPNPWSRPLPEFSFVNSQIRVKFMSNPALPSCSDDLYPKDSWVTKNFLLASRTNKDFHLHSITDFSPWIPTIMSSAFEHDTDGNHEPHLRVLVQERTEDVGGANTSWEIVAVSKIIIVK